MANWITLTAMIALLAGCRGQISEQPPIHPQRNMFFQPKYTPQAENPMFPGDRASREPVAGTVARGTLAEGVEVRTGKHADGQYVWMNPMPVTMELLERGRERYNVYCAACHDRAGGGKGLVIQRPNTFAPPPPLTEERLRTMPDGEIFNTIASGVRTMPAYRYQIPASDRWAIIAYVRALQRSQHGSLNDLPPADRARLDQ
jgi:hypothetical protein